MQFAEDLGVNLLPWQQVLFDRTLRMNGDRYASRTCLAVTARQSGKTRASGIRALAELCLWGGRLAVMAAQSRDVCLESFRHTVELAEESGIPIEKVRKSTGSEEMILGYDHQPRLKVVSSTSGGGRGLSADLVVWDELASMKTLEPYAALEKSRRARPNSQMFCITTEGDHQSVVLEGLQQQGRAAAEAGESGGVCYLEWSAPPDAAPDDRAAWSAANPALGHLIDEQTIADEYRTDPREVFERETLCRRTLTAKSWLPTGTWDSATDPTATVPDAAQGLVFAVDAAPSLDSASICVAWPRGDDGRVHLECVNAYTGTSASGDAETRLRALVERWRPKAIAVLGRGPAAALAGRVGAVTGTEVTELSGATTDRAIRAFYEATVNRRVVHPPDPLLASHLEGAQAGDPGTFLLRNRNLQVPIDAAVAAVAALWVADHAPATPTVTWVAV